MKFTWNDKEYEFHYSQRIFMLFERIQQHPIQLDNMTNEDLNVLAYVNFLATLQYNKVYDSVDILDFLNWVDDNGNSKFMAEFTTWFIAAMEKEYENMGVDENEAKEMKKDNKKGKKSKNV